MRKMNIKATVQQDFAMSIGDCYEKFERHNKIKNLSPRTILGYYNNYKMFCNVVSPTDNISIVDIEKVEDYIAYLQDERQVNPTSVNTGLRQLRTFLYFCMDRDYLAKFKITLLKVDEVIKEPYSEKEIAKLLRYPNNNDWIEWRNWAIVNYFVGTGNRISSVINLKVKDINFDEKMIKLTHTKNKKQTLIPLSNTLLDVLQRYLSLWDYTQDDYLFPSVERTGLTVSGLQNIVRKYNKKRGVTKTSIHLFRHTFAKMYIMNGGGMAQLQKLLGHSTLDMTRKYINLYGTDLAIDYEKFNPLDNMKMYIR